MHKQLRTKTPVCVLYATCPILIHTPIGRTCHRILCIKWQLVIHIIDFKWFYTDVNQYNYGHTSQQTIMVLSVLGSGIAPVWYLFIQPQEHCATELHKLTAGYPYYSFIDFKWFYMGLSMYLWSYEPADDNDFVSFWVWNSTCSVLIHTPTGTLCHWIICINWQLDIYIIDFKRFCTGLSM